MKTSNFTLGILLLILITACQPKDKLTYRYAEKAPVIACDTNHDLLLNEALHTFENAIVSQYDSENKNLKKAYGQFAYRGFDGSAPFAEIAKPHSYEVRDALIKANILLTNGETSNLNYNHPAVSCIISKIQDTKLKKTITSLVALNDMNPKLFNSRLRNVGRDASNDRYVAMYTALDAYFQHLVGLPQPAEAQ